MLSSFPDSVGSLWLQGLSLYRPALKMLASAYKFLMTPGRRARETSPSATARSLRFAPEDDQIPEFNGGVETPPGSPPSGYARTLSRDDAEGVTDRTTEPNGCLDLRLEQDLGVDAACGPP